MTHHTHGPAHTVVQAREVHGSIHLTTQPPQPSQPAPLPPAQLPALGLFVDREHERAQLERAWQNQHGPLWVGLDGPAGAGKTALACAWAREHHTRWPDGALYADLAHTDAHTTLARWLRALGYAHPADQPEELQALWRTITHHQRLLVVADNTDPHTAHMVLPAGAGCAGIAIARTGMAHLIADGARYLPLGALPTAAVSDLITRLVPQAPAPQVLAAAVNTTGGSALTARLTAAFLALHPQATPTQITQRGETIVSERLQQILESLPAEEAERVRVLACHPGPDLTPPLTAAILGVPAEQAWELLERLTRAHLLEENNQRYGFHALVCDAINEDTGHRQQAVLSSAALYYRLRLAAADERINPWRWRVDTQALALARTAQQQTGTWFPEESAALSWIDSELANIMAVARECARHGLHQEVWRLCEHIGTYITLRKPWVEAIEIYQLGLEAAQVAGDPAAQGLMHQRVAATARPDAPAALAHATQALALYARQGYCPGVASAMEDIATTYLTSHTRTEMAAELFAASKHIHLELDPPRHRGAALQERKEGTALAQLGEYEAGMERLRSSHTALLNAEPPDVYQATRSLQALVQVHLDAGELDQAEEYAHQALAQTGSTGAVHQQASILTALADIAQQRDDQSRERQLLHRALDLLAPTGHPDTHRIRERLAEPG